MSWFQQRTNREVARLTKRVRELETLLAAAQATSAVQLVEIDGLAAVVARNFARTAAETAEYHARRATAEGMPHERNRPSTGSQ